MTDNEPTIEEVLDSLTRDWGCWACFGVPCKRCLRDREREKQERERRYRA